MTCIVGYQHKGKVWIGGDSAGVAGLSITVRADRKVFKNKQFIMGFTTSFRMGQLLQYRFKPPAINSKENLETYMCTKFIDGVRKCFDTYKFGYDEKGAHGGTFLVAVKKRLFTIHGDYQVGWSEVPYNAVGCGDDLALGAMYALEETDPDCVTHKPEDKIRIALGAAAAASGGVCEPFHIVKI